MTSTIASPKSLSCTGKITAWFFALFFILQLSLASPLIAYSEGNETSACAIDIVSDLQTLHGGMPAVATYSDNPRWTASIPGATWIWRTFFVEDPKVDETVTFTRTFSLSAGATMASLVIAADNSYEVSLNGAEVGVDHTEFNYFDEGKDSYNVLSMLTTGTNTLQFDVKNWGVQNSVATSNPAGLLFKLHVEFPDSVCAPEPVNQKPVITLLGQVVMSLSVGTPFTDPGATAQDPEDGDITHKIFKTGAVDTSAIGTYTITYNATDTQNLAADTKTRTVNVNPLVTQCNDGIDNDQDGKIDFGTATSSDSGCDNPGDNDENNKPVITVVGTNPLNLIVGATFTDPGATAEDQEDGNITANIVVAQSVNTLVIGTYTVSYGVTDSQGLAADQKSRTVNVNPLVTQCNDGVDNDGDGKIDFGTATSSDPGCDDLNDNDENSKPVITLLGQVAMSITIGSGFTDPGATAEDDEDGNITHKIIAVGTVNTSALGNYTITYNATDTQNVAADTKTRTVSVVGGGGGGGGGSTPPQCSDGADNDGDGFADYPRDPGCDSSQDNDEKDTPGGGGGGVVSLIIFNERVQVTGTSTALVTWDTNLSATSRVVYGLDPVAVIGLSPLYGYGLTTETIGTASTSHSMSLTGLPSGATVYIRPVSTTNTQTAIGNELTRGAVLGETTPTECTYLRSYMRLGHQNDPIEVVKLQSFLRAFEGFSALGVTGVFDIETDKAVRAFQDKYKADVLDPWMLPGNTGYVYYTTQKKVNEIYCKRMFPLSLVQLDEITKFRALMENLQSQGTSAPQAPVVGAVTPKQTIEPTPESVQAESEGLAMETATSSNGRIDLSELLATMPVEDLTDTKVVTLGGEIAGESTKRGRAAVVESIGDRMEWSTETVYTVLVLLILAILLGTYLIRRYYKLRSSDEGM